MEYSKRLYVCISITDQCSTLRGPPRGTLAVLAFHYNCIDISVVLARPVISTVPLPGDAELIPFMRVQQNGTIFQYSLHKCWLVRQTETQRRAACNPSSLPEVSEGGLDSLGIRKTH
jgi:hypothetical protein